MKYSSKSIATTFFQETGTEIKGTRTISTFQCQCGAKRSQDLKHRFKSTGSILTETVAPKTNIVEQEETEIELLYIC